MTHVKHLAQFLTHSKCSINVTSYIISIILVATEAHFLFYSTHFIQGLLKWMDFTFETEG